jgi:hypothetical protein
MIGKVSYGFETPAYTYAEVETALAAALGVRTYQRGLLRARLKHVQRLGLIDLQAKKGKQRRRVEYNYAQAAQWLLALILAETGLDPAIVVAMLKNNWKRISRDVEQAASHEARSGRLTSYLRLTPRAMSAAWEQKPPVTIDVTQLDVIQSFAPMPQNHPLVQMINANLDDWSCFYNLTRALSRLETALPRRG